MAAPSDKLHAWGFAADAATERALRAGLAGREIRIRRGRLDSALRTLAAEPSPPLVFVDLDGAPEPEEAARELARVCSFGTVLVALGSDDTARLTRSLLRNGISDYLVKPLAAAAVHEASSKALEDPTERGYAGRVVTFAGTAGCGASTMMTAMAEGIAAAGRTATLVDLDPLAGKLATRLGVEPQGDLAELLVSIDPADPEGTDESTAPGEEHDFGPPIASDLVEGVIALAGAHISLVGYPRAGPPPTTPPARVVCMLLGQLANRTHVVMVSGMSDPEVRTAIMRHADARVLVFEPTLSSISSAVHCLALLGTEYSTLLVQCHPRTARSSLSPAQIRYALAERRPDVVVPFDAALHAAATGRTRARSPGKAFRKALDEVAERALEGSAPAAAS